MPWPDRLREPAYTSPSGERFVFDYENVRRTQTKKTTAFEFPDADGTFVQDLGVGGRRYPLRMFFWGSEYDTAAAAFEAALAEKGTGKLEHPLYGALTVIPFGEISRRDDLKTAANQAVIEVTFWETTGLAYPTAGGDPASEVLAAIDGYNEAVATDLAETPDIDTAVGQAGIKNQYVRNIDAVNTVLTSIAATEDDVAAEFSAIYDSISLGIDVLIAEPLALGFQTVLLIQSPARAAAAVTDRLDAYASLLESLLSGQGAAGTVQDLRTVDIFAGGQVSAEVVSVVNNIFQTKTGALEAAEFILAQFASFTDWRDPAFGDLSAIDTGESYQQLQSAVALAAGFLVELSFSLQQERSIVIDRPRTIIDLAAEVYGEVDSRLDFLINSNNLTGSEIIELPRGRKIVFYVL